MTIQLVLMQFNQSKDRYLHNPEFSLSTKINADKYDAQEQSLIGGGKIIISSSVREQPLFLTNLIKIQSRSIAIAIDENSLN